MEKTIKEHEDLIDKHGDRLDEIQRDLTDIRVRLGIKDLTNGQVVEYQKQLVKAIEDEKTERKEQDELLRDELKRIDDKTWFIVTGIILSILLEIGLFVIRG